MKSGEKREEEVHVKEQENFRLMTFFSSNVMLKRKEVIKKSQEQENQKNERVQCLC